MGTAPTEPAPFVPLVAWWFVGALLLYTWAGEKMPWLTMHLVVPLHLLAGWGLGRLGDGVMGTHGDSERGRRGDAERITVSPSLRVLEPPRHGAFDLALLIAAPLLALFALLNGRSIGAGSSLNAWAAYWLRWIAAALMLGWLAWLALRRGVRRMLRLAALSVVVMLLALTVRVAWNAAYRHADLASEFLVYAQGSPDVPRVAHDVEALSLRLTGGLDIKLAYDEDAAWPFIWYFRNYTNAQYYRGRPAEPIDADVVIVGEINEAKLAPLLEEDYVGRQYRLIWWPNEDWYKEWTEPGKGLRQKLSTPQGRAEFWDVLWRRKYAFSLQDWPGHLVHTFTVYVRKDLAVPLWAPGR